MFSIQKRKTCPTESSVIKITLVVVLQTCFSGSLKTQNVDFQSTKWAHETSDIGSSSITSSLYVIGKMCLRMFVVFRLEFFLCVILTFTCLWCVFYLFANYRSTIVSAKCDCWIKTRTLIYALWMLQVTMGAPRVANRKIFIEWRNSKYKGANTTMTDLKGPVPEKIIYQLFWSYWFSALALNWLLDDISHKNQNLVICSGRLIEV